MSYRSHIAPCLLFIAIAVIYLSFPTRVYYWDGIAFAQAIENASRLNASLVHPNHLIYNFAGYLFFKLLRLFPGDLRAIRALQILNSLLSAACAGVLFVILLDTLRSLYLSVCLASLFAFSATWWKFSTDANAYIPAVLFLLISFYLVLPDRKPRPLLLGVTFFISLAFHQLSVVMFLVLALGIYLQDCPLSIKRRFLNAVYFSIVAFALIVTAYGYLFYLARGSFDIVALLRWASSFSPDAYTSFDVWSNIQYSLRGQVRLFFGGRLNSLKGLVNPFVVLLIVCLVSAVIWLVVEALRRVGDRFDARPVRGLRLAPRQKTVLLLSLLWTAVYVAFLLFWLPQNTFYRLFYLPAIILLLGLALSSSRRKLSRPVGFAAVFVAAVALANFLFLIYPFSHVEKNPPLVLALEMNQKWPPGTVIYYRFNNSDKALVQYFNPATTWRQLDGKLVDNLDADLAEVYHNGGAAWFETTLIDGFDSTPEGARWLETHARKETLKELNDGAYRIRFVQVVAEAR
jgi:hypothetical protein